MKKWGIAVLFSILASYSAVLAADDPAFDRGRGRELSLPSLKIPIGSVPDSDADKMKKDGGKSKEKDQNAWDPAKEKAKIDKKVDESIGRKPKEAD